MTAVIMAWVCEQHWKTPTMIGYYMQSRHQLELVKNTDHGNYELFLEALDKGVDKNNPVDFVIVAADQTVCQEFQLKRFGMVRSDTDELIGYVNAMRSKYTPINAACLVWITDIAAIDFKRLNREVEKQNFPFTELLFFGVLQTMHKLLVVQLLPHGGWHAFDLPKAEQSRQSKMMMTSCCGVLPVEQSRKNLPLNSAADWWSDLVSKSDS